MTCWTLRPKCSGFAVLCFWNFVFQILHNRDDYLSEILHYGYRKFSMKCRQKVRRRQPL